MYQNYDQAVNKVMKFLERNNYCYSNVCNHERCFRKFKEYLQANDVEYSKEWSHVWLTEVVGKRSPRLLIDYKWALYRVNDVLENREIFNVKKLYLKLKDCPPLNAYYQELLEEYLKHISTKYTSAYLKTIRAMIFKFLNYASEHGANIPSEITHKVIFDYYYNVRHISQAGKDVFAGRIRMFLRYLVKKKLIKNSIPLTLDKHVLKQLIFIDKLSENEKSIFFLDKKIASIAADKFHSTALQLQKSCLTKYNYSCASKSLFSMVWNELFCFLEANNLDYSLEVSLSWAFYMQRYRKMWKTFRRAIMLFEQFKNSGDITPATVYLYKKSRADKLLEWCQAVYKGFVENCQERGLATATITINKAACLRFLEYLTDMNITKWGNISPQIVKDFQLLDPHLSPGARCIRTTGCRNFLKYLGDRGLVSSSLYSALSNRHAPKVNIVKILSEDDLTTIYNFRDSAHKKMQLRDIAIVMLGIRMGLRASDIVNLKLSDISWNNATIRFQQSKTGVFLKLPMPTEVGNSLYRYIQNGRPATAYEYIFVRHMVPFCKLNGGACWYSLKRVLKKDTNGFRITRKTFASRMLVNNTKPETIAEALGHSDNSTVMTYLATDGKSMRQCAISLEGIEVKGGMLS